MGFGGSFHSSLLLGQKMIFELGLLFSSRVEKMLTSVSINRDC